MITLSNLTRLPIRHGFCARNHLVPSDLVTVKQVHSSRVWWADKISEKPTADALISDRFTIGVHTADCVPLLIASDKGLFAAVHVGWKGLLAGVVDASVSELIKRGADTSSLTFGIGPHIRDCCFEIGIDVAGKFMEKGFGKVLKRRKKRIYGSLSAGIRMILVRYHIHDNQIEELLECTFTSDTLQSYRRSAQLSDTMTSFIGPLRKE